MRHENFASVNERFAKRREAAERASEERRAFLHSRIPEIKEIDTELAGTGLRIMEAALSGGDVMAAVNKLKDRSLALQNKRRELLAKNGYSPDFSDVKRECKKCSDSGYVGLDMCDCFRRELNKESYLTAGLGKAFENKTFDTINLNYASGKSEGGITPRQNLENVVEYCKKYASDVCRGTSHLMLIGGTGLGKTHLSSAIAIAAIEGGCDVYYDSVINILDRLQKNEDRQADRVFESGLLICDDFGTEYLNEYRASMVYNILNTRLANGKSILINTNLSGEELKRKYDSRICSRLFGEFHIKYLFGHDVRRLKLLEDEKSEKA